MTAYPSVQVGSLPIDGANPRFHYTIDGWYSVAKPRAELVANGGGSGAVAIGPWDDSEAYYTLRGVIQSTDRLELLGYRRQLLDALPADSDSPLVVIGNGVDEDLQVFVRRYDAPEIGFNGDNLLFSYPLVALDPLKYAATALTGIMGVFTGSEWFTTFTVYTPPNPDVWYMPFVLDTVPTPDVAYMTFQQATSTSPYPMAAVLTSPGDMISRRIKFQVTGPVTLGDWKVVHEQTGNELWADLELVDGQSVVFDCHAQTATLDGSPVDNLVFGDWLTFQPGPNTYRLVAGTQTDGYATVFDALPAYR
jgi:hypothetical protein